MSEYVLGYWNVKGLGAPIRMAFALAGKPLKEEVYCEKDGKDTWFAAGKYDEMEKNVHPFPNLPYLQLPDGKTVIVQSGAILRHVAREFHLYGDSPLAMTLCDQALELLVELRVEAAKNYYGKEISASFKEKTLPYYFKSLDKYLAGHGEFGGFLCCATPTVADLYAYDVFTVALPLVPHMEKECPHVAALLKKVRELPQLQEYFASPANKYAPNWRTACYGAEPTA